MAIAEELKVVVRAEVDRAMRDLKQFNSTIDEGEKKAGGFNTKMLAAGAAVAGAVVVLRQAVRVAGQLVDAFGRQEQAEARLEAVMRATGEAAGFSAEQLKDQAAALQQVTIYGDEAVMEMQAIIATFKSIQGDVFERTTELALDLSAAFGQDLKSSAIQLGKALEDPATGLTALRRIGVTFSEAQEDMIKGMQEAGDVAGAQAEILKVLEGQVGGTAEAMGSTMTGEVEKLKNAFGDFKEMLGFVILDAIEPLVTGLTTLLTKINEVFAKLRENREAESILGNAIVGEGTVAELERAVELQEQNVELAMGRLRYARDTRDRIKEAYGIDSQWYQDAQQRFMDSLRNLQVEEAIQAEILGTLEARRKEEEAIADEMERQARAGAGGREYPSFGGDIGGPRTIAEGGGSELAGMSALALKDHAKRVELLREEIATSQEMQQAAIDAAIAERELKLQREALGNIMERNISKGEKLMELEDKAAAVEQEMQYAQIRAQIQSEQELAAKKQLHSLQEMGNAAEVVRQLEEELAADRVKYLRSVNNFVNDLYAEIQGIAGSLQSMADDETALGRAVFAFSSVIDILVAFATGNVIGGIAKFVQWILYLIEKLREEDLPEDDIDEDIRPAWERWRDGQVDMLEELLREERRIRDENLRQLERTFSQEYDVLYDAWDRNLITTQEFIDQMNQMNTDYDEQRTAIESTVQNIEDQLALLRDDEWARLTWWRDYWDSKFGDIFGDMPTGGTGADWIDWFGIGASKSAQTSNSVIINMNGDHYGNEDFASAVEDALWTAGDRGLLTRIRIA